MSSPPKSQYQNLEPGRRSIFDADSREAEAAKRAAASAPNQVAYGKARPVGSPIRYGGELENYQAMKKHVLEEQGKQEGERRRSLGLPEVEEKHGLKQKWKKFAKKHNIGVSNSAGFRF